MNKSRALIIDDDPDLRSHLVQMFKLDGYEVREALHGREALDLLNKQDFVPDVILSDYDMPLVTGSELYRLICQVHPTLEPRFIMMSGSDKPRSFCKEFGIPFLSKPFDDADLNKAIKAVLP